MQDFFTIAKTDFLDTFQGAWIFPLLLIVLVFIFWKEKDDMRKLLLGVLPLLFLFIYWCPLTGMLFMKLLGENVYWQDSVVNPDSCTDSLWMLFADRSSERLAAAGNVSDRDGVIVLCGTPLFKSEEFQASTNDYKIPQNVVAVCDLLPGKSCTGIQSPDALLFGCMIRLSHWNSGGMHWRTTGLRIRQEIRSFMQKHRRKRLMYRHWLHWQKKRDAHFWYFPTAVRTVMPGSLMAIKSMVIRMNLPYS